MKLSSTVDYECRTYAVWISTIIIFIISFIIIIIINIVITITITTFTIIKWL